MHMIKIINMRYQSQNEAMENARDTSKKPTDIGNLTPDKLKEFDIEYE